MNNYCIACDTLITGRSDKKFCNDNCRSDYNNQVNKDRDFLMRKINKILKRNRAILARFFLQENILLNTSILAAAGFDFNYYTHREKDGISNCYTYCYEYGYAKSRVHQIVLKKNWLSGYFPLLDHLKNYYIPKLGGTTKSCYFGLWVFLPQNGEN